MQNPWAGNPPKTGTTGLLPPNIGFQTSIGFPVTYFAKRKFFGKKKKEA
jgi:hypothetical protein